MTYYMPYILYHEVRGTVVCTVLVAGAVVGTVVGTVAGTVVHTGHAINNKELDSETIKQDI